MAHANFQDHRTSAFEEDFKGLDKWTGQPYWSCDQDHLNKYISASPMHIKFGLNQPSSLSDV